MATAASANDSLRAESTGAAPSSTGEVSLKRLAMRGAAWTIVGYGIQQALRLVCNLILTRLLFPEAFGLMALVSVFLQGLTMFSDIGIAPSLIQNKRGDEPDFYNTAWTLQVLRGALLCLCSCAVAWPLARFYGEPLLTQFLPIAGLTAAIAGFAPAKLHLAYRHMDLKRVTLLDLCSSVVGTVCLLGLAYCFRSVWALIIGNLLGAAVRQALSLTMIPGPASRFRWEPSALKQLVSFGRWVFMNTMFTFLAMQSDRIILGASFSLAELGVYTIAVNLVQTVYAMFSQLTQRVFFPTLSRVARNSPERFCDTYYRIRGWIDWATLPLGMVVAVLGREVVSLLYDYRYADAGWMLQILSVMLMAQGCTGVVGAALLAKGFPRAMVYSTVPRTLVLWIGLPIAAHFSAAAAVVVVAASFVLEVPIAWWLLHRQGLLKWRRESLALVKIGAGLAFALVLRAAWHSVAPLN